MNNQELQELDESDIIKIFDLNNEEDILKYGGQYSDRQKILIDYLVKMDDENIKRLHDFIKEMRKNKIEDMEIPVLEIDNFD